MPRRIPAADQLAREGVLVLGGLRALLLQLAHPGVGHGVAEHSVFARNPLGRLHATLTYLYVVADGDPALLAAVTRRIGRLHRPVVSAPGTQPGYDARDPELQRWVAATIHDTARRMIELVWGPLPRALADELLSGSARIGTSLGLPAADWPADSVAFERYFRSASRTLGFDDATRQVVRDLLAAEAAPRWVRLALPVVTAFTAPLLPPALRAALGLRTGIGSHLAVALVRSLAPVYRALPVAVRTWPSRRYLAALRADLARDGAWGGPPGGDGAET